MPGAGVARDRRGRCRRLLLAAVGRIGAPDGNARLRAARQPQDPPVTRDGSRHADDAVETHSCAGHPDRQARPATAVQVRSPSYGPSLWRIFPFAIRCSDRCLDGPGGREAEHPHRDGLRRDAEPDRPGRLSPLDRLLLRGDDAVSRLPAAMGRVQGDGARRLGRGGFLRAGAQLGQPAAGRRLGPRRDQSSPATTLRFAAIARATQMVLEDLCLHVVRHAVEESGIGDVCLGGGVALNGVMIDRLREELALQRIFVPPSPDDAGTSAGAALALWHRIAGEGARPASRACRSRVGPSYSRAESERRVRACPDLLIEECGDWISVVAQALVEGEIVAWFQGPAEFGPRALGGRSILADPGDIGVRDKISRTVKDREGFRPFAASVVEESAKEYFDLAEPAPYMIEVCDVVESKRAVLPAVTHLDGTCRPQTVSKAGNPAFWSLLSEFGELSGYPVLLNTSLNTNGQPMVCTPEQALETFRRTPMTLLAIDGLGVRKHREDAGQAPLQSSGAVRD